MSNAGKVFLAVAAAVTAAAIALAIKRAHPIKQGD